MPFAVRALLIAALLALASSTPATAGVVQVEILDPCGRYDNCTYRPAFDADSGEQNRLVVGSADGVVRFEDAGVVLRAGNGCVVADEHAAECRRVRRLYPFGSADIATGDGDDEIDLASYDMGFASVDPGPGADRFVGSPGSEWVNTGSGADVLDGGPGTDALWHVGSGPVTIDLAARVVDDGGERDVAIGFEDGAGGPGDDRLTGNGTDNVLRGGHGSDAFVCGAGTDTVVAAAGATGAEAHRVAADCERLSIGYARALPFSPMLRAADAPLVGACRRCTWRMRAAALLPGGPRTIARATRNAPLRLSRAGRRLLRRQGSLDVRVSIVPRAWRTAPERTDVLTTASLKGG